MENQIKMLTGLQASYDVLDISVQILVMYILVRSS